MPELTAALALATMIAATLGICAAVVKYAIDAQA